MNSRRGAARAGPLSCGEARHRPAAPAGAVSHHRFGQPAANVPDLRVPRGPGDLPDPLANDSARAAESRARRYLRGVAWRPGRGVARLGGGPTRRTGGLAGAGAPRRLSPSLDGYVRTYLERDLPGTRAPRSNGSCRTCSRRHGGACSDGQTAWLAALLSSILSRLTEAGL